MKSFLRGCLFLFLGMTGMLHAHVGMPFVVLEGKAGRYPVRVVVQQPDVVPGLAHIGVRVLEGKPAGVSVLPLHWDTDRSGAPRPDPARPVPGESGLYEGELWFMGTGAYGVVVQIEGEGGGTLVVPANSLATSRKPMPEWMGWMLAGLGALLLVGWTSIGYAAFRESTVLGRLVGRRWKGALGAGLAALFAVGAVFGGQRWWGAVDVQHEQRAQGQRMALDVEATGSSLAFRLQGSDPRGRDRRGMPTRMGGWELVQDHGRLLHAFVIGAGTEPVFLHLHPESGADLIPRSGVGALPVGEYNVFLDVTHALGAVQTLTNRLVISHPVKGGERTDPDDAWHQGPAGLPGTAQSIGEGREVTFAIEGNLRAGEPIRLIARFREAAGGPCQLEPYLRMPAHAVVAAVDGSVCTHLHPAGNLSMAAARRFALRAGGDAAAQEADVNCGDLGALPAEVVARLLGRGEVTFPMVFPKPGDYRVWVQARIAGRIRTGCFRVEVPVG